MSKCIICHRNTDEGELCKRLACKEKHEARVLLNSRYQQFAEFWTDKIPNEENYKEFLVLIGKEESYQTYLLDLEQRGIAPASRRSFYQGNIASIHWSWRDEFGRPFTNVTFGDTNAGY